MMPYAMFGMTPVPDELGEWSARTALEILAGKLPRDIHITTNKRWDYWFNRKLLRAARFRLPRALRRQARRFE